MNIRESSKQTLANQQLSPQSLANAIRILSVDAVQQANSGHPGAPMGMADIAEVLWNRHIKHNPANPNWLNRDRFVLSNGHGSMLLYSILHLTGYELSLEDLKNFRQLDSKTPGHPEIHDTPGVETTTGPLGQGLANAVGMAIAERTLGAQFNTQEHKIIDHHTYVFMGDGCLMEGISHECCSLAGTLNLGKLIAVYDDNGISIDGHVEGWFTDDTKQRFEAYGWHVIDGVDGHNAEQIDTAFTQAKNETLKPSLIIAKTIIGKGSPNKQGSEHCHGAPLGVEETALTRRELDWHNSEPFLVPDAILKAWNHSQTGANQEGRWQALYQDYAVQNPELAQELTRRSKRILPENFEKQANAYIIEMQRQGTSIASRKASQNTLNVYGPLLPELLGGSADLAASNLTIWKDCLTITDKQANGNYINYGVREFGMSAIMNGINVHGGFIAYGATFLVFMEYARNAVRLAALMQQQSIFVYTHDSIGLGEDGPTHQPIEQLTNLYTTPGLVTWRPCDAVETAVAWKMAITTNDKPSAIVLSRQTLPYQMRGAIQCTNIERGGYVLYEPSGSIDAIIIATGSEVNLAMLASKKLATQDIHARVVSMPSPPLFDQQSNQYKDTVLPRSILARIAIEAAHEDYWRKYVGLDGCVIGMTGYGKSAPAGQLLEHFGFTVENVVNKTVETIHLVSSR